MFIYHFVFIFQGLDVTDFGYHLTNQVNAVTFPLEYDSINPLIYFSNFVGGIWLSLINKPSIMWARLGGVLLTSLNSVIVYSILSTYFDRKKVFAVVLISTLFITMYFSLIYIHYFTLPAILININLWILNKTINTSKSTNKHNLYCFLLGFVLVPLILSRITLLMILIIPVFIIFCYYFTNSLGKLNRINISLIVVGFLISSMLFLLFYWKVGILQFLLMRTHEIIVGFFGNNISQVGHTHTMSSLVSTYLSDLMQMAKLTILFTAIVYILSFFKDKFNHYLVNGFIILSTFAGLGWLMLSLISIECVAFAFLRASAGIVIVLSLPHLLKWNKSDYRVSIFLIVGLLVMIITPIGSDNGLLKTQFGIWLSLPLSILVTYELQDKINNKRLKSMYSLLSVLLLSVLIISVFFQFTNVYRDDQNRLDLNTRFTDPTLSGIYSTPERVKVVDELLLEIRRYSDIGDTVLIVNDVPMFYYLTETNPALGNSWIFLLPLDKIKHKQQRVEVEGELPIIFVYSKINTENRRWPTGNTNESEDDFHKLEYFKDKYINELEYSLLWENEAFAIYGKTQV